MGRFCSSIDVLAQRVTQGGGGHVLSHRCVAVFGIRIRPLGMTARSLNTGLTPHASPLPPTTVRALHSYREKVSALSAFLDLLRPYFLTRA